MSNDNVFKLIQPGAFEDQLTEILRHGARTLLAQAVEAEVADFLAKHADLKTEDGRQRVVRHGHLPEREVMTGIGPVAVRQPRVRDREAAADDPGRVRFTPAILPPYLRRSKSIETLLPILYSHWLSIILGLASVVGCGYLICVTLLTDRFSRTASFTRRPLMPGVTILKPLHGTEQGLLENLASFCTQNYPGPVQIIFGVQDPRDDAIAVVERLRLEYGSCRIDLVVDATMQGLNRKVSNLVNMSRRVQHEIVVVADSDIRVDPEYLSRVVAALDERGASAVTCVYHGIATPGVWARLAELGINAHFLPSVIFGLTLGLAYPCFGSTIAFKRKALAESCRCLND